MKSRREAFTLSDGAGRIEVRGDDHACGLFVDARPVTLNWCDCAGSIGQVFCHFGERSFEESVAGFRGLVEQGPDPDQSLFGQFFPLLRQFPAGEYRLTLAPLVEGDVWFEWKAARPAQEFGEYYPYDGTHLIPSQCEASLDLERVFHWIGRIDAGERPLLVTATAEGALCEFVLDGHHKLLAYTEARVKPWRLCICGPARRLAGSDWPQEAGAAPVAWKRCLGVPAPGGG